MRWLSPALLAGTAAPCLILARRGSRSGSAVALCGVMAFAAGSHHGAAVAAARGRSCVDDLRSGDAVTARGRLRESVEAGDRARVTLDGVTIVPIDERGACPASRLVTWVDSVDREYAAGSAIAVRGEWIRLGFTDPWPRPPGRAGIVTGRIETTDETDSWTEGRWSTLTSLPRAARARASDRLRAHVASDVHPIARALVLAERDAMPGSLRARFADAGLAHLLAISGLHVGLIGAALLGLLASVLAPGAAGIGASVLIWLYVWSIGAPPSAVRAAFLMTGWGLARARGRPARMWDLLGVAAMVALTADPLVLVQPGFQLSFAGFVGLGGGLAAVVGLRERIGDPVRARRPGQSEWVRRAWAWLGRRATITVAAFGAGVGAFLATAPIVAAHFQHVAPAAIVSHLFATPLVAGSIAAVALTLALPDPVAGLAGAAATVQIRWLAQVADLFAHLPNGSLSVPPPGALTWTAMAFAAAGLWRFARGGRLVLALTPLAIALALTIAAPAISASRMGRRSLVCTVDVGQGDAAAIRTSAGRWILFDAGPRSRFRDAGRSIVLPFLRQHGASRVELFVLSHPDLDHLGGLGAVLDAMPVLRVLDSGDPVPSSVYLRFLARASEERVGWMQAAPGDRVTLDDVAITILGPPGGTYGKDGSASNATSLQVRVTIAGAFTYVNTGDATAADELALLQVWPTDSLRADLLKIGHHGSRTSTDPAWLRAVDPTIAVVSAGRGNPYGHPHRLILSRLTAARVPFVWRTDRDGTLCVEVERNRWRIRGERRWRETRPSDDA